MSKIDIINSILHQKFCDKSEILIEKDKDKYGETFEMKRNIVCKHNIEYTLYKYDHPKDIFPFFTDTDPAKENGGGVTDLKKNV